MSAVEKFLDLCRPTRDHSLTISEVHDRYLRFCAVQEKPPLVGRNSLGKLLLERGYYRKRTATETFRYNVKVPDFGDFGIPLEDLDRVDLFLGAVRTRVHVWHGSTLGELFRDYRRFCRERGEPCEVSIGQFAKVLEDRGHHRHNGRYSLQAVGPDDETWVHTFTDLEICKAAVENLTALVLGYERIMIDEGTDRSFSRVWRALQQERVNSYERGWRKSFWLKEALRSAKEIVEEGTVGDEGMFDWYYDKEEEPDDGPKGLIPFWKRGMDKIEASSDP
jgi:hypothetical protein